MVGYRDDDDRTAEVMRGNAYHTGDVASIDDDGYITYVGRTDDVFKASDYRISPFELESVLIEHPAVAEAAVVPSPDPTRLAVPKAYVVLAAGHAPDAETAHSILAYCREHLAPYKRIRRIEFAELPKTISGKIRRVELRGRESASTATAPTPTLRITDDRVLGGRPPGRGLTGGVRTWRTGGPGPGGPANAWAIASQWRSAVALRPKRGVLQVDPLGDQQGELDGVTGDPLGRLLRSPGPDLATRAGELDPEVGPRGRQAVHGERVVAGPDAEVGDVAHPGGRPAGHAQRVGDVEPVGPGLHDPRREQRSR